MSSFDDRLKRILSDRRSGSSTLTIRLIKLLLNELRDGRSSRELTRVGRAVDSAATTFPMMALFKNLREVRVRTWRLPLRKRHPVLLKRLQEFRFALESSRESAAQRFAKAARQHRQFLTLSSSGAVISGLHAANDQRAIRVVVCESRPACEGVAMARKLSRLGIHTDVVTDAQGGGLISEIDAVVLGADWLHPDGFVNKTGSRMLSDLACFYNKELYVIGSKLRFNRGRPSSKSKRRAGTIDGLLTSDFEWVPWNDSHRLVTELGIESPSTRPQVIVEAGQG